MNLRLRDYIYCAAAIALLPLCPHSADALWAFTSVKSYGATGNGTTDDTAAINSAIATETNIYFPPGTYKFVGPMTLLANKSYHIYGDGPGVSTIRFTGPNAGINGSNIGTNTLNVDGLTLAATTANTGTAIYAAFNELGASTKFHTATIHNVQIIGFPQAGANSYWNAGITLYKAQHSVIDKVEINGTYLGFGSPNGTQTGIVWESSNDYATTGLQMTSVEIKFVNTALRTGGWVEGLYLSEFEFICSGNAGLPIIDLRALPVPLAKKSGFHLASGNVDMIADGIKATNLDGVKISKILFNHNDSAERDGAMVIFDKCFDVRVANSTFVGGTAAVASPTPIPLKNESAIRLTDTHSAQITGNYFTHLLAPNGAAIEVDSASDVVRIINNVFEITGGLGGVNTPYDDQASGTYYRDNNQ